MHNGVGSRSVSVGWMASRLDGKQKYDFVQNFENSVGDKINFATFGLFEWRYT